MRTVKVKFSDGNEIITQINGTEEEIKKYYAVGSVFNIGDGAGGDKLATVNSLEFIDKKEVV
jgi:hypothetical protein